MKDLQENQSSFLA